MEYKLELDEKTKQKYFNAFLKAIPLGRLAFELFQDISSKENSNGDSLSITGLERRIDEAAIILPEISRFSRTCYLGQQIVRILGPVDLLWKKGMHATEIINPLDSLIFVSSEKELTKLKDTIAKEGKDFRREQHQFLFTPELQSHQQNEYLSEEKKLFQSINIKIKSKVHGLILHDFGGLGSYQNIKFEFNLPMLDRFMRDYLEFAEKQVEVRHSTMRDYYFENFKKHDWCVLPWCTNYAKAVENNLLKLGLRKID